MLLIRNVLSVKSLSLPLFKRHIYLFLGLSVLFLILGFSACSSKLLPPNTEPLAAIPGELRIGFQVIPNAELLAKAQGLVKKKFPETKVKWISYKSGRLVNQAMAANDIDLGLCGSVPTAMGIAQGLSYKVYFIHDVIGDNEALVVKQSLGIKTLADLEDKKIAVPFGSTAHFSLLSALAAEDIESKNLTIVDLQPPEMLAAWQRGEIDGGFIWHPTLNKMLESGGEISVTAKDLAIDKGIITADVAIVHDNFLKQYPKFLEEYISVLDEAIEFYRNKPQQAAEVIAPELGISPEESLQGMNELVWLNSSEQADIRFLGTGKYPGAFAQVLKDSADFMVSQGAMTFAPELSNYRQAIFNQAVSQASNL
ncbi:MAG: ABC transporter substrate-binding protein [Symploca sp. SIO2E9]|nr:ABC transporter substrate-binding protein [Symploca sp. SIO2E9]